MASLCAGSHSAASLLVAASSGAVSSPVAIKAAASATSSVDRQARKAVLRTSVRSSKISIVSNTQRRRPVTMAASSPSVDVPVVELDPDNSSIFVAGGAGVALELTKLLAEKGAWVWALQRKPDRQKQIEGYGAIVTFGDALKPETLKAALAGKEFDAVVSTVGSGIERNTQSDSEGNINLIKAAQEAGIKRFILVTSLGCGDSKDSISPQTYQVLEPYLVEKTKAEDFLKESGLAWTIIRPGGLKSEPATGTGVVTTSNKVSGFIHRPDVASLVARALFDSSSIGKTFAAFDKNAPSPNAPEYEAYELKPF